MQIEPPIWETDEYMPATWRVLAELLREESLSQSDLRERTGLSHPVVVQQVAQLRKAGVITLGPPLSGRPGRPRVPINFNWDYGRLLAVEVHHTAVTTQATNLAGQPLGDAAALPLSAWTQDGIRAALETAIRRALAASGARWAGLGIVLPAAIAPDDNVVNGCCGMPDWQSVALGDALSALFELPVVLQNASDALARAAWAARGETTRRLVAISLRHDGHIAQTIIDDGHLMRGADAAEMAGGLGHLPVEGNTRPCACGHVGCLETLLRAGQQDPAARAQAVRAIGISVGRLAIALQPEAIVIQGDAQWTPEEMAAVRATVDSFCPPAVAQALQLGEYPYDAATNLLGAASQLADRVLRLRKGALLEWVGAALS